MTGRAAEAVAVSVIALVVTVVIAAPVLRAPSDRIFGRETVGRHHDPFTVMEQFERPIALGVYAQPLTDVPGALIARLAGPVAAYNWLVLVTFPLSAAAAYLLARQLTLAPPVAAISALAFAFSPFHLAHAAYHPQIAQTQWVPIYFLALWRALDEATPATIGLLAAAVVGVTLSNFYGGLIAAAVTPAAILAYWLFTSRHQPRSLRHLALTVGSLIVVAGGGIGYAWYAARAVVVNRAAFSFPREDLFRYSAKWWSYLLPPVAHPLLGGIAGRIWSAAGVHEGLLEQQVSLGWGWTTLAIVAALAWLIHRQRRQALAAVPVLAAVSAVALLCSLSPERAIGSFTFVRPSAYLYRAMPMFRSYARFGVVVQLMTVLLAGIGAEYLWRSRTRRGRILCVALLALAMAEYAVWPPALWRDVLPTMAHRWVARQPGPVHALDCAALTSESASIEWLTNSRISLQREPLDDCMEPEFAGKLAAAGYTHLLVRLNTAEGRWFAAQPAPDGLRLAARFSDGEVFAVTAARPPIYTVEMTGFSGRESDQGSSWRWMGIDAAWTIVNTTDRTLSAALAVQMTAFHVDRGVIVRLDGHEVQALTIAEQRGVDRVVPLALTPGAHILAFHPVDPPTIADEVLNNGDRRPLSLAFGAWHWSVE